jgi:hypothetical protein
MTEAVFFIPKSNIVTGKCRRTLATELTVKETSQKTITRVTINNVHNKDNRKCLFLGTLNITSIACSAE